MLSRLATWQLHIIGAITAIVLAAILFLALIKPKMEQITQVESDTKASQEAGGTPEKVQQHKKELDKAVQTAKETRASWQVNERKYMPNLNFQGDLLQTYQTKLINIPTDWGRWVSAWYDAQRNLGVSRLPGSEFPIESFPTDPNYISTLNALHFPNNGDWPVTVEAKSFNAAMAHLRRFNTMEGHGMPVINNVSLAGQSPNLAMNYELALYVILPSAPPPSDPTISPTGAGGTGAGGGMMGGGRMGGMPGMMGGGMPGMMGGPMGMPGGAMGGRPAMMGGPSGMAPNSPASLGGGAAARRKMGED